VNSSDYTKSVIATACWRAARGELHSVMLSVCQVFMNRAAAGWCDGDLYENCVLWLQQEYVSPDYPDPRDPQFQQLLNKLETVTSGLASDKTGGALWFCPTLNLPEKIEGTPTTTIGGMTFIG
jgi:hypothetical protein